MQKKTWFVLAVVAALNGAAFGQAAPEKPRWIDEPRLGAEKHGGAAGWYYDVGVSNMAASEQLARTRARQNVQQMAAQNIASQIHQRIDITEFSESPASSVEDPQTRFESALTNSIKTAVPRFEILEWYIERGKHEGKDYWRAYVLVRFPRKDILNVVEELDMSKITDTLLKQLKVEAENEEIREELIEKMETARNYALVALEE